MRLDLGGWDEWKSQLPSTMEDRQILAVASLPISERDEQAERGSLKVPLLHQEAN